MRDHRRPRRTRGLLLFLLGLIAAADCPAASIGAQLATAEKQDLQREARLVVDLLQNHHFSGRAFREMESKAMVARFLEGLDPRAEFLEAGEIEFLHRRFDRTLKSVYLFRGDLQPAFEIFDLFVKRAQERLDWVQRRLDRGFEFTGDETTPAERRPPAPFASRPEADHHWELRLKELVLVEMLRGRTDAEAVVEVQRRFARMERTIAAYDSLTVRERFFDAIIRSFDPHSGYFSADSTREFAVEMEKAVVGLGLELRKDDGHCRVEALQSGGPADLAAEIQPGDIIEAVAEDGTAAWTDLSGLRLREIVGLLRGQAGTRLRLAYRRSEETARRETTLERTRVGLGSDRARGAVSEVPAAGQVRRIGWVHLPSFYASGENSSLSSVTRDVRELLDQMDLARLDGLVLDLRNNPGGAVTEAVALSELFLPEGVMMLSRGLEGKVIEHNLKPGPPAYGGPLVVLVSAGSASASEVFAGAMKYHRRALVAGDAATYGKGTVQNYLELAKLPGANGRDWGTLRLTRERFYLPDGAPVQGNGVAAHVVFPDPTPAASRQREADLPGALPAESVPPPAGLRPAALKGASLTDPLLALLQAEAGRNSTTLPEWELMRGLRELEETRASEQPRSLQFETRRQAWRQQEDAIHAWERQRQALADTSSYRTIPLETKLVQELLVAEDARLRATGASGKDLRHRLHQGSFVVETASGRLRKVALAAINFHRPLADVAKIAPAYSAAAGQPIGAPGIEAFLRQADLLEHPTEEGLLRLSAGLAGTDASPEKSRERLELLLKHLVLLDDGLRHERATLDVPLREAQRLAAAWAAAAAPASLP